MAAASASSSTFDPSQPIPEQAFVFLSKDATGMFANPASPQRVDSFPSITGAISLTFSRDGEKLAVLKADGIDILPAKTPSSVEPLSIKRPGLLRLAFSPLGSYLLTWERWQKPAAASGSSSTSAAAAAAVATKPTDENDVEEDEEEEEAAVPAESATSTASPAAAATVPAPKANDNLLVWSLQTGNVIASFQQKNLGVWPSIQWSTDEKIAARLSTNELHFYAGAHIGALVRKLRAPGITQFSIAPGAAPYRFCIFIPEKKGQPASIRLHEYPITGTVLSTKNFFRAQRVALHWNKDGKAVLVVSHTDEDASGRSYYGETGLYLLSDKEAIRVPLAVDGTVYDCAWRPDGKQYAVVYGSTPASITLFNAKSEPLIEFPKAHRNTLRWAPNGHILCVAGFGTFAGEVDFWDIKRNALLGSMRAKDTITCDWSPDSKYFLTSTLAPRLKVDNGFKMWNYYGKLVHQTNMEELYQVTWRPAAARFFDPRPPAAAAPEDLPSAAAPAAAASGTAGASSSTGSSAAPPGRYRHPNSRVGSLAEQQVAAEAPKPKKLQKVAPPPKAQERVLVGGALAEPAKKKKQKKKGKAAPAAKPAAAGFSIQVADD